MGRRARWSDFLDSSSKAVGEYAGATGRFTERERRDGKTAYTFHLSIPD